jgi:hypothetical protein
MSKHVEVVTELARNIDRAARAKITARFAKPSPKCLTGKSFLTAPLSRANVGQSSLGQLQ